VRSVHNITMNESCCTLYFSKLVNASNWSWTHTVYGIITNINYVFFWLRYICINTAINFVESSKVTNTHTHTHTHAQVVRHNDFTATLSYPCTRQRLPAFYNRRVGDSRTTPSIVVHIARTFLTMTDFLT